MNAADAAAARVGARAVKAFFLGDLDACLEHRAAVAGIDGGDIGAVDPDDPAFGRPQPDRHRRGIEHGAEALDLLAENPRVVFEFGDLAALAGQRTEAQGGKAAGGAAIGFEQFIELAAHADIEGVTHPAQGADRFGQGSGRVGIEPACEVQQLLRLGRQLGGPMHAAGDPFRHGFAAAPDDQHMGFGGDRRFGLIETEFEFADAAAGDSFLAGFLAHRNRRPHKQG